VNVLAIVIVIALLGGIVMLLSAPLRRAGGAGGPERETPAERLDLEVEREAKYREIRDAELDHRTGKLSAEDYQAVDAALKAEAIEILDRLERTPGGEED
jgi:hypothetical protein